MKAPLAAAHCWAEQFRVDSIVKLSEGHSRSFCRGIELQLWWNIVLVGKRFV